MLVFFCFHSPSPLVSLFKTKAIASTYMHAESTVLCPLRRQFSAPCGQVSPKPRGHAQDGFFRDNGPCLGGSRTLTLQITEAKLCVYVSRVSHLPLANTAFIN